VVIERPFGAGRLFADPVHGKFGAYIAHKARANLDEAFADAIEPFRPAA
jgi:hypothetical protein